MARRELRGPSPERRTFVTDPLSGQSAELRRIQPHAARKAYRCPGCNQEISPGTGHVVVVPLADPAHRRHWHTPCFARGTPGPGQWL